MNAECVAKMHDWLHAIVLFIMITIAFKTP